MCCCNTKTQTSQATVQDPVCGMNVDPANLSGSTSYDGKTYFFCSTGCKRRFDADPTPYLAAPPAGLSTCCSPKREIGAQ
jgi:Cu+-exporting ATPase